jgi:hypothetical protein
VDTLNTTVQALADTLNTFVQQLQPSSTSHPAQNTVPDSPSTTEIPDNQQNNAPPSRHNEFEGAHFTTSNRDTEGECVTDSTINQPPPRPILLASGAPAGIRVSD